MAYSELIKNFDRIRDYMRQFYVYGFKSRTEYDQKSARSYDNERRRVESWLGEYMRFRKTPEGKNVFLSVDSRAVDRNPLYKAFKTKSFTDGDITFHFYLLDLLMDGEEYTAQEITDLFSERYLPHFTTFWQPDLSTIRKKLKEYAALGLLECKKQGRELVYRLEESNVDLPGWQTAAAFFTEADPLGVVGSYVLDRLEDRPDWFRFKHHYMLHALDSQVLLALLEAIGEKRWVTISYASGHSVEKTVAHRVYPLKIYCSTQWGRQYLLCRYEPSGGMRFFRLDHILSVTPEERCGAPEEAEKAFQRFRTHCWGTAGSENRVVHHLEMTIRYYPDETYIPQRLEREKRNGTVEHLEEGRCRYSVDAYNCGEMVPWLRTFIGRIEDLQCSDPAVLERFYGDLEAMAALYGGED